MGLAGTSQAPPGFDELRAQIDMDPDARLRVRGQEMILMPRHFFRDIQKHVYEEAGPDAFAAIFGRAGYEGARKFCRAFRAHQGGSREEAVEGYFEEMSLRGWGQFSIRRLEPDTGVLEIELERSALPPTAEYPSGHVVWAEAARGALDFACEDDTRESAVRESVTDRRMELEERDGGCRIRVEPRARGGES